jgi:hypothetical protein
MNYWCGPAAHDAQMVTATFLLRIPERRGRFDISTGYAFSAEHIERGYTSLAPTDEESVLIRHVAQET